MFRSQADHLNFSGAENEGMAWEPVAEANSSPTAVRRIKENPIVFFTWQDNARTTCECNEVHPLE